MNSSLSEKTTQQLILLSENLMKNLNNKEKTAAGFLDVEKAFNRVWHKGLLHKALIMGVDNSICKNTFKICIKSLIQGPARQHLIEQPTGISGGSTRVLPVSDP